MKKRLLLSVVFLAGAGLVFSFSPLACAGGEPIILGLPTAVKTDWGHDVINAVNLAVEEINADGGVLVRNEKRPFEVKIIDTRGMDPSTPAHDALMAVEKLILQKKPHAIVVGFARSEIFMAGMDLIAKHEIPYLGSYATTHMFQKKFAEDPAKYKYLFRLSVDAIAAARAVTDAIDTLKRQHGLTRVFFMPQDTLLSKGFNGVLKRHCEKTGWEVVGWESIASDATDFSAVLTKVKEAKTQMICTFWDVARGGTILLKQWSSMQVPALLVGFVVGANSPRGWDFLGEEIEYSIYTEAPIGSGIPLEKLPKTREFVNKFINEYGKPHGQWLTGAAYDAIYVLAGAIERTGCLDPEKLVAELEKTDYDGVIGRVRFDETHQAVYGTDPEKEALCLAYQWQDGKQVPIYPPSIAEGKVLLPPWMKK
jgi:branched-chain amino acid transport system substrate-binding protein